MSNIEKYPSSASVSDSQSELLVDLSETEEATISAGFGLTYLYLEQEIISSDSANTTEIEGLAPGEGSGSTNSQATFDSKRTTFAFGGLIPINSVSSFISSILKFF